MHSGFQTVENHNFTLGITNLTAQAPLFGLEPNPADVRLLGFKDHDYLKITIGRVCSLPVFISR